MGTEAGGTTWKDEFGQGVQIAMTGQCATFMRIHVATAPSDVHPCPPFGPSDCVHIHCGSDRHWEKMAPGSPECPGDPGATHRGRTYQPCRFAARSLSAATAAPTNRPMGRTFPPMTVGTCGAVPMWMVMLPA